MRPLPPIWRRLDYAQCGYYGPGMATEMPEPGRLAAHVLLDALSVAADDPEGNQASVQLAIDRLADIGAVTATANDADELTVNVEPLVGACLILLEWFMHQLDERVEDDATAVIIAARTFVDEG